MAPSRFVFSTHPLAFPLLLLIMLCVLAGALAYQAPVDDAIAVGWLGDQLFIRSNDGLRQEAIERGEWFTDSITADSPTGRSRWTRQRAIIRMPYLGSGVGMDLTLLLQGWPTDVVPSPTTTTAQPRITVRADGIIIGYITPTPMWDEYTLVIAPTVHTGANLTILLETDQTFTDTARGTDPRPKGVRVAGIQLRSHMPNPIWQHNAPLGEQFRRLVATVLPPVWQAILTMTLIVLLWYGILLRLLRAPRMAFLLSVAATAAIAYSLTLTRIWMGAILAVALWVLLMVTLLVWHTTLLRLLRALVRRYTWGHGINYGIIAATLAWVGYATHHLVVLLRTPNTPQSVSFFNTGLFPDALLIALLGVFFVMLLIVWGNNGVPRAINALVHWLGNTWHAAAILLLVGIIWLGYETHVIFQLPYVGHADYADNAVVARNLVAGRGWVVDYVTQFYQLYATPTRHQETWPLLQPVWIAPFIALFGSQAWAVKLPNILFTIALMFGLLHVGSHLWDKRVGLLAAIIIITNHLFFKLIIYATSDLAFVVFSFAAIYTLYVAMEHHSVYTNVTNDADNNHTNSHYQRMRRWLLASGIVTGLMMLQKPSGAVIAVGMGVWLLVRAFQDIPHRWATMWHNMHHYAPLFVRRAALLTLTWVLPALLILAPYLIRNSVLFDAPVYSTEGYDAWVLGYRGNSQEAWNDIYRVYIPALGGEGVPDRSWLLRWGFDLTFAKMLTQIDAVRDYLLPTWAWHHSEYPNTSALTMVPFFSHNEQKNLLAPVGAWLSLLGAIAALRYRRRWLWLLMVACVPYVLFLITYWHANEERYFLMAMPWLALLVAWMVWAAYDRIAAIGDTRYTPIALVLVCASVFSIMQPSWRIIASKVVHEPTQWAPDIAAYEWLREHTPPDAVVMTRNPWQLNWHAERPAVMIPQTKNHALFLFLVRHYAVHYLVFDTMQRVKGDAAQLVQPLTNAHDVQVGDTISLVTNATDKQHATQWHLDVPAISQWQLIYSSPTPDNRVLIYELIDK